MARRGTKPDNRAVAAAGAVAASAAAAAATRVRGRRREQARRFRLADGEPVADGIRRIAQGQLDLVAEQLDGSPDPPGDEQVHEVRKAFKRLRALVRLTREELGAEVRRRENAEFREAGRRLSDARDARVLLATFDGLVEPGTFARGLKRIHRRARRAYRAAEDDSSSEHLHELRKRTKDLRHAAQILRPTAPKRLRRVDRDAHELSDVLGADHDLATLLDVSRRYPAALTPQDRELFERLIERRRAELQGDALRRADKLYATKARKLARLVS